MRRRAGGEADPASRPLVHGAEASSSCVDRVDSPQEIGTRVMSQPYFWGGRPPKCPRPYVLPDSGEPTVSASRIYELFEDRIVFSRHVQVDDASADDVWLSCWSWSLRIPIR